MVKLFIKKNALVIIGVITGAAAGFLYWNIVGCQSGGCAITSSPMNSAIWGAAFGGLLLSLFQKRKEDQAS